MEHFSVAEAVEQAVQTEKLGYDFYTEIAKKFKKDEKLKELFETLALKEQQHEKVFSGIRDNAGQQIPDDWGEVSKYLRAIVESEFFLGSGKSLQSIGNIKTAAEAVRFAMGFEKETLLYFYNIRDLVSEKAVIDKLINEEKSHIVWLSDYGKHL